MSFCNLKCFLFNLHRIWDRFDGTKPGNYFTDRQLIKQAINTMNEELAGCIRFSLKDKEYTGGKHVRVFRNWKQEATANGCYATIGNAPVNSESHLYNQFDNKDFQIVSLGWPCVNEKTIIHEFVHTIGFFHEHARPDRDAFITPNFNVITGMWVSQWQKRTQSLTFGVCYNPKSVMQYQAHKKNGEWEVQSKVCIKLITMK